MERLKTWSEQARFLHWLHEQLDEIEHTLGDEWPAFHDYLLELLRDLSRASSQREAARLLQRLIAGALGSPLAPLLRPFFEGDSPGAAFEAHLGDELGGILYGDKGGLEGTRGFRGGEGDASARPGRRWPISKGIPKALVRPTLTGSFDEEVATLLGALGEPYSRPRMEELVEAAQPVEERYFNALFTEDGVPLPFEESLIYDRTYTLYVDISPDPTGLAHFDLTAPVAFPDRALTDLWVEAEALPLVVWAASHDFEIRPSVQRLSLPQIGPSEAVTFAVRPLLREGRGHIQVELFFRGQLLQSQRLEAEIVPHAGASSALSPRSPQSGAITFTTMAQLDPAVLHELPPRRLTIDVARDPRDGSLDLRFLDRTGGEERKLAFFDNHLRPEALAQAVQSVRAQLLAAVTGEQGQQGYAWVLEGDEALLTDWLARWAMVGHTLYRALLGRSGGNGGQERLHAALLPDDVIQVNPVVGMATLPWALLYERPVRLVPGRTRVCPDFAGCEGAEEGCSVASSPDDICPYAFWGYRYAIEQLPCWVTGEFPTLPTAVRRIENGAPLAVSFNVWRNFSLWREHLTRLRAAGNVELLVAEELNQLLDIWESRGADLGLIYFYSHGGSDTLRGPYLQVSDAFVDANLLEASGLEWRAAPLVFLNGCATGDYGPESFVSLIADFRAAGASGVVGTECPVPELFAEAYAARLLPRFFAGEALGGAMLAVRRELLREAKNPLGLLYTLYAAHEVALVRAVV